MFPKPALLPLADRNYQAIRLVKRALKAVEAGGFVEFTPELSALADELEKRALSNSKLTHPQLITLALWKHDLTIARQWHKMSPAGQSRVMDTRFGWNTIPLITIESPAWNYTRDTIVKMAWLAALEAKENGHYADSLTWFRRGVSLAPGRVPREVRLAYYETLSMYLSESSYSEDRSLADKYLCLGKGGDYCSQDGEDENAAGEVFPPQWNITSLDGVTLRLENSDRLIGLDLDQEILAAGVDVAGVLYWQGEQEGESEVKRQRFVTPNLAVNSEFEFRGLFRDSCVDGYIGSHAYVLPCVSRISQDPQSERRGPVANTQTTEGGYLLVAASAPAVGGQYYVFGASLCSLDGASAKVGLQLTSEVQAKENPYAGLSWADPYVALGQRECWQRTARVSKAPENIDIARVWLGGFGIEGLHGEAEFDSVFLFELDKALHDGNN
jgi:hypothetical protein